MKPGIDQENSQKDRLGVDKCWAQSIELITRKQLCVRVINIYVSTVSILVLLSTDSLIPSGRSLRVYRMPVLYIALYECRSVLYGLPSE